MTHVLTIVYKDNEKISISLTKDVGKKIIKKIIDEQIFFSDDGSLGFWTLPDSIKYMVVQKDKKEESPKIEEDKKEESFT